MTTGPKNTDEDFRAFMASRWPRLLRAARLLTGNHHDAEDLVQAALSRAYVKWDKVEKSDQIDAYVWRILVNTHATRLRRTRLRELLSPRVPEPVHDDATGQVDARDALVGALTRLPRRQRTVLVLCFFEDMSPAQAAAVLGTTASTVRSQSARAIATLRADGTLAALREPARPINPSTPKTVTT
ncbi:SigE family RNA polymerase sigma factor [Yinghuangia seranimata]|uniref:SigE family RNA polymerase sigma factor n=1 Tax=Yinghuangia seranimata TaxID=408067 RepID=UPI00248BA5B7|nr:SigE family RNA polymerase sigma factor [Yinghuangia seranimata]MDI2125543.1 SigE family RNA polymerase sigma factor [Yinghuangia seranimata]